MPRSPANRSQGRVEGQQRLTFDVLPSEPSFLKEIDRDCANTYRNLFSPEARSALAHEVKAHAEQLITLAAAVARRAQADRTSASDVNRVADTLVRRTRSKLNKLPMALGGVLLGAGLSAFVSILLSPHASSTVQVVTISLCVTGSFLIGLDLTTT